MATTLRPNKGGFIRPFGCGWFIREFLLGHAPQGSPTIDEGTGACQSDIFYYYKLALHKAYAEDIVARENERRIRAGRPAYTPEEYEGRVDWYLRRIPYKLAKARYHSFRRYFHWLKQLEWVAFTGEEETSTLQEVTSDHPDAHPRKLYRLTRKGLAASDDDWAHPQRLVLPEVMGMPIEDYFREKRRERKYRRPRKGERYLRPFTAGMFIREYLMGLGPEESPKIDPDEGDYAEHIFFHYKEALRRAYARDAVAWENERRAAAGLDEYSAAEYAERLEWQLERIPYKLHRARSISFFRYFHYLKQLGFVESTGREEASYLQDVGAAGAPPQTYYRLSAKGKAVSEVDWFRPQLTLYPEFSPQYFAHKNRERREKAATES